MINKYIVVNMKMNLTAKEIGDYLKVINETIFISNVIICPTSIYIPYFLNNSYDVGIQNIYFENDGSYTGEISPLQAKSIGVKFAIVGHSDRRLMGEDDQIINKKIHKALTNNLKVIFCIGETLEEREMLKTDKILKQQIIRGLRGLNEKQLSNILIAYEPVWAVGTNVLPTNKEISDCASFIKNVCKDNFKSIPLILYGGSINEENIKTLNKIKNIDGFLIGSSANDAERLVKIIEVIDNI